MNSSCQILSTYFNAKKYRENTWTYQKTENQWKSCPSGSSNIFQYISSKHRIPIAMVIFCLPIHQALSNSDGAVGSPGGWEGWCSIGKWFEFSKDCQDSWNLSSAGFEFLDHFFLNLFLNCTEPAFQTCAAWPRKMPLLESHCGGSVAHVQRPMPSESMECKWVFSPCVTDLHWAYETLKLSWKVFFQNLITIHYVM